MKFIERDRLKVEAIRSNGKNLQELFDFLDYNGEIDLSSFDGVNTTICISQDNIDYIVKPGHWLVRSSDEKDVIIMNDKDFNEKYELYSM